MSSRSGRAPAPIKGDRFDLLSTALNSGRIEARISDRGPGVPMAEQAEFFSPFVRGSTAHAEQIRGSGLGLSLVREILSAQGGTVFVESKPGQGATFVVQLPIS